MLTSHHLASARFADTPDDYTKLGIQPGREERASVKKKKKTKGK